jgi:hypothetical protein
VHLKDQLGPTVQQHTPDIEPGVGVGWVKEGSAGGELRQVQAQLQAPFTPSLMRRGRGWWQVAGRTIACDPSSQTPSILHPGKREWGDGGGQQELLVWTSAR